MLECGKAVTSRMFMWKYRFSLVQNEYRNIMCYPGRILTSAGCLPLLQTTRNLGYIISLGLTTELANDINETVPFFISIKTAFRSHLKRQLHARKVNFTSSIVWACSNCTENIWHQGIALNISVYQDFVIFDYVDRLELETKLLSICNSNFLVAHKHQNYTFKLSKDVEALRIESYNSSKMGFIQSCFIRTIKRKTDTYVYSKVSRLLTCKQIELEITEFRKHPLKLIILAKAIELDYDEYDIMSSGKARICLETFRYIFKVNPKLTSDHDIGGLFRSFLLVHLSFV
ncbi:unnamed protein product [Mytilus coruscus]|uniref:Uncharacterized protein n=1 Tax=Mytilus coruscus TaxID=42192 RepID=A0A6J8DCI4_MYTCO|nr:unnamed protein product [Mytilus coruscus]